MSYKKHKLIFENWRKYLSEEEEQADSVSSGGVSAKELLKIKLPGFVAKMNTNKDEVINALLKGLNDGDLTDDAVEIQPTTVEIRSLRPTQAEVVFGKSVNFAIQNPKVFMEQYESNGPHKVGAPTNNAIITLNKKFIIDGHHRWSSLFCVNPRATIHTFNIQANIYPTVALKMVQASIKAYVGQKRLPMAKGGGINLFKMNAEQIKEGITTLVTDEIAQEFVNLGYADTPEAVLQQLITHYQQSVSMLQKNKPVQGATPRPPMPQTDAPAGAKVVAGGDTPAPLQPLEKGQIDWNSPHKTDKK